MIECPDCKKTVLRDSLQAHIAECEEYVPTYINNVVRFISEMTPNYMEVHCCSDSSWWQKWTSSNWN